MRKSKREAGIERIREAVIPILIRHGATRAGFFGSLVRREMHGESDVDILVELDLRLSLLDVVGIEQELEDVLGRCVDLVEYDALKPAIRDRILADEVRIL